MPADSLITRGTSERRAWLTRSQTFSEARAVALPRLQKRGSDSSETQRRPTEHGGRARADAYNRDLNACDRLVCSGKLTVAAMASESNDASEWRHLLSRRVALSPIIVIAGMSAPAVTLPLSSYINPVPDSLTLDSWISSSTDGRSGGCQVITMAPRRGQQTNAETMQRYRIDETRALGAERSAENMHEALRMRLLADHRPPSAGSTWVVRSVVRADLAQCRVTRGGAAFHYARRIMRRVCFSYTHSDRCTDYARQTINSICPSKSFGYRPVLFLHCARGSVMRKSPGILWTFAQRDVIINERLTSVECRTTHNPHAG